MFLIAGRRACINAMHRGIDCRRKYNLHFKLERRKELVSAMNTAYQQYRLLVLNINYNASIRTQNKSADLTFEYFARITRCTSVENFTRHTPYVSVILCTRGATGYSG